MSFLIFIVVLAILLEEGKLLAELLLRTRGKALHWALALPLASFTNVLLIFVFTIFGIPLSFLSFTLGHALIHAVCFTLKGFAVLHEETPVPQHTQKSFVRWVCFALLSATAIYSLSHAVLLPSFQYDSATNWTMRSEISWVDGQMAFDANEARGMAKPQYPFLFHALQIAANQGQSEWNDTAANTILWLLSLSVLSALFLMIKRIRPSDQALLIVTLITSIPLIAIHLAQGYGDINLLQVMLLSLATLALWLETKAQRWLLLSAVLTASCVWIKSEGLFFAFGPWLLLLAVLWKRKHVSLKDLKFPLIVAFALAIPWPLFALSKGFLLTPHGSDTTFAFHSDAVSEVIAALFTRGSFGVLWYAVPLASILLFIRYKDPLVDKKQMLLSVWGWLLVLEVLFIYLCTPNVRFLLNAESFYRQMMIPGAMLILGLGLSLKSLRTEQR